MKAKDDEQTITVVTLQTPRQRMLSLSRLENVRDACGVKCVRRTLVPVLTPEEEAFRRTMQESRMLLMHHDDCAVIDTLDSQVRGGHVRLGVAGALASEVHERSTTRHADGSFLVSLIYCLLHGLGNCHPSCTCLTKVLAWGTCPHVSWVWHGLPGEPSDVVRVGTPLHTWSIYNKLVPLFLSWGSPPWHLMTCNLTAQGHLRVQSTKAYVERTDMVHVTRDMAQQWWRWHARASRRGWLAVVMST